MRERTRYQGGSLLGYVAVAILLAGLLVGGLYWVQRYNQSSTDTGIVASNDDETNNNDEKNTSDSNDTATTETNKETNSSSGSNSDEADSTNSGATSSDDEDTTADENTSAATDQADGDTSAVDSTEADADVASLPETGPAETLAQTVAVGLVAFSAASYIKSRRTLDI